MSDYPWLKSYPPGVRWDAELPASAVDALFDAAVQKWPNNVLCDFLGKRVTYDDMADLVDRAAKGFQKLGVGKGVHVGLFLPNTPHYIVCFFGILKAGGTVVNYSPLDAARELEHKITDSETDILVTLDLAALYPRIAPMLGRTRLKTLIVGSLQDFLPFPKNLLFPIVKAKEVAKVPKDERHLRFSKLIGNDGRFTPAARGDLTDEIAVLQYTGGTTGAPKGAMLTHANLSVATEQLMVWTRSDPPVLEDGKERILAVLPLFHIYALTVILLLGIRSGATIILHPRFELENVLHDLEAKRPTMFPGVPTMYTAILNHPKGREIDMSSLKFCNSGGAPLPPEVQQRFQDTTGCRLTEGWGMTETSPTGTGTPVHGTYKPGSCGIPLPGILLEFVDVNDPLKVLPLGETGELCITGPNVMKGYWNKPDATAEAFAGGRFHTGDIGYMDADGYVFIVDRKKDMIISGGFNVYPRNIEDAIYEHEAVSEVIVIGIPDEYRGQAAKAFIKLKDGAKPFTLEELLAFLGDKLGRHELPVAIEFRKELPKTLIGKLSKKELVEEEMRKRASG